MNVLIFGATGMVGQGVLRECLLDPDVQRVQAIGRTPTGVQNAKLRECIRIHGTTRTSRTTCPASMRVSSAWA
jgi:dihydrodipicolinate reductase